MSSIAPQPDPQAADEIVAYLDGELPPQDCRRVENRLASDEDYRQQLHELDRAWEALDALPTTPAGDDFARTTIELACIAAKDDVKERAAILRTSRRSRMWRWIAASTAAIATGLLLGYAALPNPNKRLLADLPAIHQVNVLPFVKNVEVLRQISKAVPTEQMVNDDAAFARDVRELENANASSIDARRDWVKSLPPDEKAELANRARAFSDLPGSPEEQQRMRNVMEDIRNAPDAAKLQATVAAYGQWVSRHSPGQQHQFQEELDRTPLDQQAEAIRKRIERESELAMRHLSPEDAEKFRKEIFQIVRDRRPEFIDRISQNRKIGSAQNMDEQVARQAASILGNELLKANPAAREDIENRLINTLSPTAREQWSKLARRQRDFGRGRQLLIWLRDAMNLKVDPEALERFFAEDPKLTDDQRERLLNQSRTRLDNQLEQIYFSSELGVDVSQFGEPNPAQRNVNPPGRAMRRPGAAGLGGSAGPGPGSRPFREQRGKAGRPDGPPGERGPLNPRQSPPNPPPPKDGKQEAI